MAGYLLAFGVSLGSVFSESLVVFGKVRVGIFLTGCEGFVLDSSSIKILCYSVLEC